jgi:hypothetical protein
MDDLKKWMRLVEALSHRLVGSQATGQSRPDSDWDFVVEAPHIPFRDPGLAAMRLPPPDHKAYASWVKHFSNLVMRQKKAYDEDLKNWYQSAKPNIVTEISQHYQISPDKVDIFIVCESPISWEVVHGDTLKWVGGGRTKESAEADAAELYHRLRRVGFEKVRHDISPKPPSDD